MWDTRHKAEATLNKDLKEFANLFDEIFATIDQCIMRLDRLDDQFGRVCAITLTKGRNLGLGCYSLSLDALAQEAGALFRPLIESLERLTYFKLDPTRINEALEGRLPKPGDIAKRIDGKFKNLREHLNTHASHLSLSPEAMIHLVDFKAGRLRLVQVHNTAVLRQNLVMLLAILIWLAIVATDCTSVGAGVVDDAQCDSVEDIKRRTLILIDKNKKP